MNSSPYSRPPPSQRLTAPGLRLRRFIFFLLIALTTLGGVLLAVQVLPPTEYGLWGGVLLMLFSVLFAWVAQAFWTAGIGFLLHAMRRDPLSLRRWPVLTRHPEDSHASNPAGIAAGTGAGTGRSIGTGAGSVAGAGLGTGTGTGTGAGLDNAVLVTARTALVMPIHNEDPERVLRGLEANCLALIATGQAEAFAVFVLSDTTDALIAAAEEQQFSALQSRLGVRIELFYRRRPRNTGGKAGNIEDFCQRWGAAYRYLVILDADSLMEGNTLLRLVQLMEANPQAALLQTVPVPVRQTTLFGRLFQFAGWLYGPMQAAGTAFWSGSSANYWGHNAIIRVAPFIQHCQLPRLPGGPPLGGAILSHDFVEAALLRRAGWEVWLVPELGGSYEELPTNLAAYLQRDRRWTQGNLQHLRLLRWRGLNPVSRIHFLLGAASFLTSLIWTVLMLSTWMQLTWVSAAWAGGNPNGTATPPELQWAYVLLLLTAALLLLPRLLGTSLAMLRQPLNYGGRRRLLFSSVFEALVSMLLAPLIMLFHARFIVAILSGRTIRWDAQPRAGAALPWAQVFSFTALPVALGIAGVWVSLGLSPLVQLWMAPVLAGLLSAPLVVRATSSPRWGELLRSRGWLMVPAEMPPAASSTPGVLAILQRLEAGATRSGSAKTK